MFALGANRILGLVVILGVALSGCAAPAATAVPATPQPTAVMPTQVAVTPTAAETGAFVTKASGKITANGFNCPEPSPRMEVSSAEVNLFVWTEYFPADMLECFQLVYGIRINKDEFSSAEEAFAKLSKGAAGYDLVHLTDNIVPPSIRLGLIQKLDHARLPMQSFSPAYLNPSYDVGNVYTIPFEAGTSSIVVNTDKVPEAITSWNDLWKPEYKGRIVAIDDSREIIGATLLTLGYDPNTTDRTQIEEAGAKLKQLMPNVVRWDSDSPKTELLDGTADIGVVYSAEALLAQRENPAMKYVFPKEGPMLWQDNWGIPADSPHEDAAYAFLNYTFQADVFWLMMCDFPYSNPVQAAIDFTKGNPTVYQDQSCNGTLAQLYDDYMASDITNTPAEILARGHRALDVGDAVPLYDQIWTEAKGSQ